MIQCILIILHKYRSSLHSQILDSVHRNCDILMYQIEQDYRFSLDTEDEIFNTIISKSTVDTILDVVTKNILKPLDPKEVPYILMTLSSNMKRFDVLNRIYNDGMVSDTLGLKTANKALISNDIDMLHWLDSKGWIPDQNAVTTWISEDPDPNDPYSNIRVLEWLEKRNIFLTSHDLDTLIISEIGTKNILQILQWSYERGIVPTQEGIDTAIDNDDASDDFSSLIQWLEEHTIE